MSYFLSSYTILNDDKINPVSSNPPPVLRPQTHSLSMRELA